MSYRNLTEEQRLDILKHADQETIMEMISGLHKFELDELKSRTAEGEDLAKVAKDILNASQFKSASAKMEEDLASIIESSHRMEKAMPSNKQTTMTRPAKSPLGILNKGKKNKLSVDFNLPERTLTDSADALTEHDVVKENKQTRIVAYKDELVQRITSAKTFEDYKNNVEWLRWYVEEEISTLSAKRKYGLFTILILLDKAVVENYGMDVPEVIAYTTNQTFNMETEEDFFKAAQDVATYSTTLIKNQITNLDKESISLKEFSDRRSEYFSKMYRILADGGD